MRATWRRVFLRVAGGFECELCMRWSPAGSRALTRHCPDEEDGQGGSPGACDHHMCEQCIARLPISLVRRYKGWVQCVMSCPWCRVPVVTLASGDRARWLHGSIVTFLYNRSLKLDVISEILNGEVSVVEEEEEEGVVAYVSGGPGNS